MHWFSAQQCSFHWPPAARPQIRPTTARPVPRLTRAAKGRLRLEADGESAPLWNEKAQTLRRELLDGGLSPVNDRYWREQRNIAVHVADREEVVVDGGGIA